MAREVGRFYRLRTKAMDVKIKVTARPIVMRSRFLSMTPVPPMALGMPPPNELESPVPLPEWSNTAPIRPRLTIECRTTKIITMAVIIT